MIGWLTRAACALALVALLLGGAGCAKKEEQARQAAAPATEQQEKPQIPEELMTQAARLFGAPFEREVHMKMTYTIEPGETNEYFVYRDARVSRRDDLVVVTSRLVNAPQGLDQGDTLELRKDGVWITAVGGSPLSAPFLAMPAQISEGSKWSYEDSVGQVKMSVDVVAVRKEKVKVPLGEFEAWRIESKGTVQGAGRNGTVRDVSYYVERIGIVKSEMESSGTRAGPEGKPVKTAIKLLLEAIPEP